jgi:hypothetical protein
MAEWRENQLPTPTEQPEHWVMYFDGSLKLEGAGAGLLLISPKGEQLKYVLWIFWKVSNNESEYETLLHGLRLAISLGIKRLLVSGADGPPGPCRRSVFLGSSLVVLVAFTDCPRHLAGLSAWSVRTVRPSWPDSPPVPGSFAPWFVSSLFSYVLPRVLQGIVPKT